MVMKYLVVSSLFALSCTPTLYYPTMQSVPSFKHKGQYLANYGYSIYGHDFQLGYAASDHIALLCNGGSYSSGSNDDKSSNGRTLTYPAAINGNIFELGGGYFHHKSHFIYECYAFAGGGSVVNQEAALRDFPAYDQKLKTNFLRLALQPSITYHHKAIELAFSTRYSYVHYHSISNTLTSLPGAEAGTYIRGHPSFHFIEPALTLRVGWHRIKFQIQAQRSILMNNVPSTNHYNYIPFAVSVGCNFKF